MPYLVVKIGPAVIVGTLVAAKVMVIFSTMLDALRFTF